MKNKFKEIAHRIAIKTFVATFRFISRPDFLELLNIAHAIYDLAALHCKWLPELPPIL